MGSYRVAHKRIPAMTKKRSIRIAVNDNDRNVVQLSSCQQAKGIFGCPICDLHSGYYQIDREYWFYCHVHRTKWLDEAFWTGDPWPTPAEKFRAIDQLAGYRQVVPSYLPGTGKEEADFRRSLVRMYQHDDDYDDDLPF